MNSLLKMPMCGIIQILSLVTDADRKERIKTDPKFSKLSKEDQYRILRLEIPIGEGFNRDLAKVLIECIYEYRDFYGLPLEKQEKVILEKTGWTKEEYEGKKWRLPIII
jgi:hypothetical protein